MHTGVDWAAPLGTPIYASGNGVIEKIGLEGGYGKYIRIRHANGYETAYGHMSAFARNLEEGKRVRQGQVIGYVGSTGLSTGAHVHYEILINGRFVDPDEGQAAARPRARRPAARRASRRSASSSTQVLARATPAQVAQSAQSDTLIRHGTRRPTRPRANAVTPRRRACR